ncbi:MAG TPA: hypothetical protein VIY49_31260 [Bryobacteraceae bacterium]
MAEQELNVEDIKEALVSSGVLKSAAISEADQEKIQKALAARGVTAASSKVICSRAHYCIVIPK